nr:MAG TPA: DVL family [Caudoviricetes sp.]
MVEHKNKVYILYRCNELLSHFTKHTYIVYSYYFSVVIYFL